MSILISSVRFVTYTLVRKKHVNDREKKPYKETVRTMKFLGEMLIKSKQLNEDFSQGPEPIRTEAGRRLLFAFILQRDRREEEDFYLYAAQEWMKDVHKQSIRASILFFFLNFSLYISAIGLTRVVGEIEGIPALLLFAVSILFSFLGFYLALLGKGWKIAAMIGIHAIILYQFTYFLNVI